MKVTMLGSISSVVLLFVLLFSATDNSKVKADVDPLLPTCKTVGGGSMYAGIDFCMAALGSDKRSRGAESYRSLSIIAVDLLTANVTSTATKIDGLLQKGGDATTIKCLQPCQALYREIVKRRPGCAAAVKNGSFKEAQAELQKSAAAAKECDSGFRNGHVTSPVAVEDDNAFKLAKLADGLLDHAT
ncbi:hypothetical protein PR202_gb16514 [Eleusine coracana subsp. coracana]|uniref:Pectinesterase inhibitor domain-containing protein n=1 Tax=Eleusine coracana subsp. coracana TaxID=191504 RepID=A0AAV5F0G9_ELECO|nr:hypothetical protein QOZ80_9BG0697150 [Eleusine coracana subsp. coracana]GJN28400.1 hypothetical protein PR202_gb16514 [Eleusine coracana subsp. coracana]